MRAKPALQQTQVVAGLNVQLDITVAGADSNGQSRCTLDVFQDLKGGLHIDGVECQDKLIV